MNLQVLCNNIILPLARIAGTLHGFIFIHKRIKKIMMKPLQNFLYCIIVLMLSAPLFAAQPFVSTDGNGFVWIQNGKSLPVLADATEWAGVLRTIDNLCTDAEQVTGVKPAVQYAVKSSHCLIIGTVGKSVFIDDMLKTGKINGSELIGKTEKYILQTVKNPLAGVEEAVVIAGSDKRGTIYGIYELSAQMGVSPWYWWADVPVQKHDFIAIRDGIYTDGEPAVRYRGIFLNDEAPCLSSWAKHTYGGLNSRMYEKVFELILRLKGNFLWPAMWNNAFYDDDPQNGVLADEMGIVMGTSHHEPMAQAQQDWKRRGTGAWNYSANAKGLQDFWATGIERAKNWEKVVTVGMRGDGDEPMSEDANVALLQKIVADQRKIIEKVTGKKADQTPQVWALYKEVQEYYKKGMRVPDDVTLLLCDDNWGNVRFLPDLTGKPRKGGYGLYYHVDYVGAPRNYKFLNVTPIQNMWEQLQLTFDYGVDRIWMLNVGDLKPMEYPITLFLDMAWNPKQYAASNLLEHSHRFCAQQFGEAQADEAMRILNLYGKYSGRVTPEMLDCHTYNLETGEWKQVADEYVKLEAEALRQYISLKPEYRDAYRQLLLFPVQAMANLYEMYYAQAMNHKLYKDNNPQANEWAGKVERAFKRDAELCREYNEDMAGGKWKGMMTQKHIGYTTWNDNFPQDKLPGIFRIKEDENTAGNYVFTARDGVVSMEAEHYFSTKSTNETAWTTIPYLGRTLSGVALMPYTKTVDGAELSYKMQLPQGLDEVTVIVVVKSTLAFANPEGHKYSVGFEGGDAQTVNFNADLNEKPENIYTVFYPTVARRAVAKQVKLKLPATADNAQLLVLKPLDPGIVFEKIVIDFGGYEDSYLFMNESPVKRIK
jgi:hypothetical protein